MGELLRLGHDGVANVAAHIAKALNLIPHLMGRLLLKAVLLQVLQLLLVIVELALKLSDRLGRLLVLLLEELLHPDLLLPVGVGAQFQELVDILVPAGLLQPKKTSSSLMDQRIMSKCQDGRKMAQAKSLFKVNMESKTKIFIAEFHKGSSLSALLVIYFI